MTVCPQPACRSENVSVYDSRPVPQGTRRRRRCNACGWRWTTFEVSAEAYAVIAGMNPTALDDAAKAVSQAADSLERLREQAALIREAQASEA